MFYRVARILNRKTILGILGVCIFLLAYVCVKYGTVIFGNIANISTIIGFILALLLLSVKHPKLY